MAANKTIYAGRLERVEPDGVIATVSDQLTTRDAQTLQSVFAEALAQAYISGMTGMEARIKALAARLGVKVED